MTAADDGSDRAVTLRMWQAGGGFDIMQGQFALYRRAPIKVAAIIPAYNEEDRIGAVLSVVERAKLVHDIVVVDDGSTDRTLEMLPTDNGVRAVRLATNVGKGGAMWAGAHSTDAEIVLFLDADLVGLEPDHVRALVAPVAAGEADMSVGVFHGGRFRTDLAQRLVPYISGQRAVRRDLFLSVPQIQEARAGVEVALTDHARVHRWRVTRVPLRGITHIMKEEKMGPLRGVHARARMYWEIARYISRQRCRRGAHRAVHTVRRAFGAGRKPHGR